jgi:hypothetical protein
MTDLTNIMSWCNEKHAIFEIKHSNCHRNGLTTYNCKIIVNFYDCKAIFVFKADIKGEVSNQCVYRLYNFDSDNFITQHTFEDFGVDLLDVIFDKITDSMESDFVDDFE